jgi:myo-inositol-1(or 4)-monophosphatase
VSGDWPAEPEALKELAVTVAEEAGVLLRERVGLVRKIVSTKSSITDMVTEVDAAAERMIVDMLLAARPHDGILAEEGSVRAGTSGVRWVIDPLDGTTNFLYRFPAFAVSIAAEVDGESVAGVVHDASRAATFAASLGGGATLDGKPIHVSAETDPGRSLVGTGFGYEARRRVVQGAILARVIPHIRDIRRAGSAALDLCFVANGTLDAYYESGLNPWDVAAGELIVREAGGMTGLIDVGPELPPALVAAAPGVYRELASIIAEAARAVSG